MTPSAREVEEARAFIVTYLNGMPSPLTERLTVAVSAEFARVRAEAIEECAKEVDGWGYRGTGKIAYEDMAAALRSLSAPKEDER